MAATTPRTPGNDTFANPALSLFWLVSSAWAICALALFSDYARGWVSSGTAFETLLLIFGPALQSRLPLLVSLFSLNAIYTIASTSWLLHIIFTTLCWPLVLATSIAQYVAISSFTRSRLRWLLRRVHFYRDKVAFFEFPVLTIDTGIGGFVAVDGLTASLMTLSVEFHSIALRTYTNCEPISDLFMKLTTVTVLKIGKGHEIHVQTDSLEIRLFRRIVIGEIYAAHKCLEDNLDIPVGVNDESTTREKPCALEESRIVKDNIMHEASLHQADHESKCTDTEINQTRAQVTSSSDQDAELRYNDILGSIRASDKLHQMQKRLKEAHGRGDYSASELIELRALLSTELRTTGVSPPHHNGSITTSKLKTLAPEPDLFEYVPSALRGLLWAASHTHTIACPSISLAGSGQFLNDLLSKFLFRRHFTNDDRICELENEISEWLSVGEYCVDIANITALAQVPLRSMYDIKAEARSTGVTVSRIDADSETSTQMASLKGADGTFTIPTCLLPHHAHLVPPEPSAAEIAHEDKQRRDEGAEPSSKNTSSSNANNETVTSGSEIPPNTDQEAEESKPGPVDPDTLPVSMSIRATLPAHFDESFLSFAATLSKAGQMLDIDEQFIDPPTPPPIDEKSDPTDTFREKFAKKSSRLGSAIKHPLVSARGTFHREMRKTTVMTVNGAWFAKWTNKILEQLEWLSGDVGYTFEVPVSLKAYR
ncbi:hypothetical protein Q7P37_005364 [Cladosporium fusiforme]